MTLERLAQSPFFLMTAAAVVVCCCVPDQNQDSFGHSRFPSQDLNFVHVVRTWFVALDLHNGKLLN